VDSVLLEGLQCHSISTACELQQRLQELQPHADAVAMAAAVADHRRAAPLAAKLAKNQLEAELARGWEPVPDLLVELVARRPSGQRILGFAAHSGDVLPQARVKFARKGCDLLFANPIDQAGAGFGVSTNCGWLLGPGDAVQTLPSAGKFAIAHQLLDALVAQLSPSSVQAASGCS
jgi:phosphopantothenoylcysteine decarboxylase/phosphopantothenate--cysteine ligase